MLTTKLVSPTSGIKEGIVMSAQIKLVKMAMDAEAQGLNPEDEDMGWRTVLMDYEDCNLFVPLPYNFSNLPVSLMAILASSINNKGVE